MQFAERTGETLERESSNGDEWMLTRRIRNRDEATREEKIGMIQEAEKR